MVEPRLATHMHVSALIRQCSAQGDYATVIRKGDSIAGSLVVVSRIKGQNPALFERFAVIDNKPTWQAISKQTIDNEMEIEEFLSRRIARDPDIWILELDVAYPERLDGLLGQQS